MNDITIEVCDVSKTYKLYNKPMDRVKETFKKNVCLHKDFYAVKNVSFSVKRGETVGIIGKNGAGKSTLLKMITGVLTPTTGTIRLSGTVSALLELGTGFDAERNGIDNIFLNGRINGLSKKEISDSLDEILEFADIGDFVYQPVKTYSSGMLVRLAFATAVNVNPEILIVDEALSVGDVRFQQKCYRKIREFKEKGTVLFVSHDTGAITSFCDRVIWIDDGKVYKEGEPREIIEEYLSFMRYDVKKENDFGEEIIEEDKVRKLEENSECTDIQEDIDHESVYDSKSKPLVEFGNYAARFTKISIRNDKGETISQVESGQHISFYMELEIKRDIEFPILGFNIKNALGDELIVTNTVFENVEMGELRCGQKYCFEWQFTFPNFHAGNYPVDIALAEGTYLNHEQVHFINDALIIKCVDNHSYQDGRGSYILTDVKLKELSV